VGFLTKIILPNGRVLTGSLRYTAVVSFPTGDDTAFIEKLSLKIMLLEKFIRLSSENSDQLPPREQQNHPILNSYFMNGQSCLLIKTAFYEDRTTHTIRLCFLDHTIEQFYVNFTTTWLILDLSASYAWLEIGSTGLGCRVMWSTTCIISVAVLSKDHQD
jgi:hypothetical protein